MSGRYLLTCLLFLFTTPFLSANVVNFDSLDTGVAGVPVTNQFAGLTFTNALALTEFINLNEFDFPPRSSGNVVTDDHGAMTIDFATPVGSVGGYFTYVTTLTLRASDIFDNPVGTATSLFSINTGTGGAIGSSPNEWLSIDYASGISRLVLTGDPAGSSFALDDLTYGPAGPASVPEPGSLILVLTAAGILGVNAARRRARG